MICGGFMVDLAYKYLPENDFYDAICETRACIPDSIQILTPCTIGNGWLKIIDTGRFALVFYNKSTGQGVRVYLDQQRLEKWPEFKVWAMKLKPKKEQDKELLINEIINAGSSVYAVEKIIVDVEKIHSMAKKKISLCTSCGESFRNESSQINNDADAFQFCPACSGDLPFTAIKSESPVYCIVDNDKLTSFNRIDGVMCASLPAFKTVRNGQTIAGTRAIPLYLEKDILNSAISAIGKGSIFSVMEFRKIRAGIIITGSEIASGKIKDRFAPVISKSLKTYGCKITSSIICNDKQKEITDAALNLIEQGSELVIATGGLSVDPDDVTKFALEDAGMVDVIYGAPILPGAMTLLGKIGNTDVIGVPAGALYSEPAALDILLPLIIAGIRITRADLAKMGSGGLLETSKRKESDFDD